MPELPEIADARFDIEHGRLADIGVPANQDFAEAQAIAVRSVARQPQRSWR